MGFLKFVMGAVFWLVLLVIAAPIIFFGYVAIHSAMNRYTHHFRLVLEVEDHGEIRTGSSVIRVTITPPVEMLRGISRGSFVTQGEAVVVELSTGKLVVATLNHGPTGNSDQLYSLAAKALGRSKPFFYKEAPEWQGWAELRPDLIPLIVTFDDLEDPYSIQAVPPEAFPEVFGSEIRFHRMWIEMTTGPVTRGIEEEIPFLATRREELARVYGRPFVTPNLELFTRGR